MDIHTSVSGFCLPPKSLLFESRRRSCCPLVCPQCPTENPPTISQGALPHRQAQGAAAPYLLRHCSKIRDGSCLSSKDLAVLTARVLDFTFLEIQAGESGPCPSLCLPACNKALGPPSWKSIPWAHSQLFPYPSSQRTGDRKALSSFALLRGKG